MQLSRFFHLTTTAIISTLLLHAQIPVTYPCSPLDKLSNAYSHASFRFRMWKPHHFQEWRLSLISALSLHYCKVEFSHSSNDLRAILAAAFLASFLSFVRIPLIQTPAQNIGFSFSQERLSQGDDGGQWGFPPCGFPAPLQGGSRAVPSFIFFVNHWFRTIWRISPLPLFSFSALKTAEK